MKSLGDPCILEERICNECGECELCDLDTSKKCDNCCQCITVPEGDFAEIQIEDILLNTESKTSERGHKGQNNTYKVKHKQLK